MPELLAYAFIGHDLDRHISAGVYPTQLPEHWHCAVMDLRQKAITVYPEWEGNLLAWFRKAGIVLDSLIWQSEPYRPSDENPWGDACQVSPPPSTSVIAEPALSMLLPPEPGESIYFIQAGNAGFIKIGYSATPNRRFRALQTGSPLDLRRMALMAGDEGLEAALHRRFAPSRVRGEWFLPTSELLGFIRQYARTWDN